MSLLPSRHDACMGSMAIKFAEVGGLTNSSFKRIKPSSPKNKKMVFQQNCWGPSLRQKIIKI